MEQQLVLLILLLNIQSFSMEISGKKRKLSANEAIELAQEEAHLLRPTSSFTLSKTPKLDKYKCAFILGCLKPNGITKLYRKIPHEIGALIAQKKHMGKKLTLQEELELWKWNVYMTQKYCSNPSK